MSGIIVVFWLFFINQINGSINISPNLKLSLSAIVQTSPDENHPFFAIYNVSVLEDGKLPFDLHKHVNFVYINQYYFENASAQNYTQCFINFTAVQFNFTEKIHLHSGFSGGKNFVLPLTLKSKTTKLFTKIYKDCKKSLEKFSASLRLNKISTECRLIEVKNYEHCIPESYSGNIRFFIKSDEGNKWNRSDVEIFELFQAGCEKTSPFVSSLLCISGWIMIFLLIIVLNCLKSVKCENRVSPTVSSIY